MPSPRPSPKFGRGSHKRIFLPFSQVWEKGPGDEGLHSGNIVSVEASIMEKDSAWQRANRNAALTQARLPS